MLISLGLTGFFLANLYAKLTYKHKDECTDDDNDSLDGIGEDNGLESSDHGVDRGQGQQDDDRCVDIPAQRLSNDQ